MPLTLYLIDGHALAYRAYFALTRGSTTSFTNRAGEPTAGVYGFTSVLMRILEHERPDYLVVAFDTGRTFRDDIYPEYKGTRAKMPDDMVIQIERVRQLVDAFNIPRLEIEGYEADDVLGSVAHRAVEQGFGVKIITGDKDLLQLVDDRILVYLPGKTFSDGKDYRAEDVVEYLGVRPEQVVDYKALVGDTSDNIPGVAGIGEKTAIGLLKTYGTLDEIYAHLDDLPAGVRKRLEAGKESAYLSKKLAQIVTDLDIKVNLEEARTEKFDPSRVEALFRELEFRSLLQRLIELEKYYGYRGPMLSEAQRATIKIPPSPLARGQQLPLFEEKAATTSAPAAPVPGAPAGIQTTIVTTPEELQALASRLRDARVIAFDTETTSTEQMRAELVGISLAVEEGHGYYIPVGHRPELGEQLPLERVLEALRGPMTDAGIPKVGHNLKYDFVMLARNGLRASPLTFDTMIAEWLANPISRNLGLKNLAWVRLDRMMTQIEDLIGKGKDQRTMAEVPIAQAADYAAADAEVVLKLMPGIQADLEECAAVKLLEQIEMPLVPVLSDMEMAGVSLDSSFLATMSAELRTRMAEMEARVHQAVGEPFNLNSTQQLSMALFERLKLSPPDRTRRTASGHYSTSADVLDALRGKHPVVDWVLEYRELAKLKSTYVDALPLQVNPQTGRIHTTYHQTGAVTGRIASSDPNLQNIPIRSELGAKVRKAFIASPGHLLLSVDYSQVELRLVAHMANDQAMIAAFLADQDIHATTAAAIYGVPLHAVNKEQRRRAKGINFGLIYGISAFGLTRYTDLTLAESEDFMDTYFKQFPGVKEFLDNTRRRAADQGYVETLLGRRRYFMGLKDQRNVNIRNREEREAINAPVQGTAADIMKIAMARVPGALAQAGLSGRMLLQVHDELVLECPEAEVSATAAVVKAVMESAPSLHLTGAYSLVVPLRTEARIGPNWGEMRLIY